MPVSNSPDLNKIGILLLQPYRGGGLRFTKKLAEMILQLTTDLGTEVVLSVWKGSYNVDTDFQSLLEEPRFSVRETIWKEAASQQLIDLGVIDPQPATILPEKLSYPHDGGHNFLDCHAWIVISDRTMAQLAPIRPYALFPLDFLQRYVPETFGTANEYLWNVYLESMLRTLRNANLVLCTTPQTSADAISFAGVAAQKVRTMLPFLEDYSSDLFTLSNNNNKELAKIMETPYFLWVTNPHPHKNHMAALDALEAYYNKLNGQLRCLVCGIATQYMRQGGQTYSPYAESIMNKLNKIFPSDDQVLVCGEQSEEAYWHLLRKSQFVWHNVIADNGTYSVMEAAMVNTPSLSSDYPQIRFFDQLFGLNLQYFPACDPEKTASALKEMEEKVSQRKIVPSISFAVDYKRNLDEEMRSVLNELQEAAKPCLQ